MVILYLIACFACIGTYNNQYMVLDLKKVTLNQSINDSAFWVVEQIPGWVYHRLSLCLDSIVHISSSLVVAGDQTAILREGYWASYNVPFYEEISRQSGIPERVEKAGFDYSHDLAPRAKIFRRDQSKVCELILQQYNYTLFSALRRVSLIVCFNFPD